MSRLVIIFALMSFFSFYVPAVQAESLDNFPQKLGAQCQRGGHSTRPETGFIVFYLSMSTMNQMSISTRNDTTYIVEAPGGEKNFSGRHAALEYIKKFCN